MQTGKMAAGGGGGSSKASSSSASSAGALESSLDRKFQSVTNTMESIQGLSSWCIENKKHHSTIVYHWMKWLRRCECGGTGKGDAGEMEAVRPRILGALPAEPLHSVGVPIQLGRGCSRAQTPFLGRVALVCRGLIAWNFSAAPLV